MFIFLAGVFLALIGFGILSSAVVQGQQKQYTLGNSIDPLVPAGFDCSKIQQLGIDKQENLRAGAIMIFCGAAEGGSTSAGDKFAQLAQKLMAPLVYGTTDVDLITGTETFPHITQSETYTTANPDNPNQIVVAYNDSRGRNASPSNISGASVSTNGGTTFTRLTCANNTPPCQTGQSPFSNTFGDPVLLYNKPTGTWFTIWLDGGSGGQGVGGYKSTTPADPNSWTHFTVHNNSQDDRESGYADNNPTSPFFGRMYVSWNDFNVGGGALFATYSSDNGNTWHSPIQLNATFVRDVQITADKVTGDVYVAAMDEMGGGLTNRANQIYRSTDGGNTWTNTYTGPAFPAPGRVNCSANPFFVCMYSPNTWRHQGWGEPAAYNHVVSLVYASRNTGNGDPGDVYYIRSTDSGVTFSAPFKLNTDSTTRLQWMPNLSVSDAGTLFSVWYDERESVSCTVGNPAVPCYRMWARKSNDNGATWLPDDMFSDVVSPVPAQPDPGIAPNYQGDYDYGSAIVSKHLTSWVDGRVPISGTSQQNVFFDRERPPTPGPCQFRVLIAYSDTFGPPTTLQNQILAEPGVIGVDLFDSSSGTPPLQLLEQYNIVVPFSNSAYNDATAMGNVLADYADAGGIVVGLNFDWFGAPFGLAGRWITGGYTPFDVGPTNFTTSCLGNFDNTHPLMQGISAGSLCAFYRHNLTLSSGAVSVALYQDNLQLVAYKHNNGHTGVGINAYLGANQNFSGPFGRVIVNAGKWLLRRPATDFDHNGRPDYALYNGGTRQTAVWYMNNNVFAGSAFGPTLPAGWNLADVADFNGDGNPDYALFNPTTRQTAIWYLSGVTFIGGAYGPTLPSGWTLVATGDFNDDCKPDYVLYNPSTRRTAIWYLNNYIFLSGAFGPTLPTGWNLAGVADFNGDGQRDYLLFNGSTRQTAIWYLFGVTFVRSAYGPTIASGYQLQGTADFNQDGKRDYVLYNPSTRRTAIWYLNNYIFLGGAYGPILPTGWNLVAP